MTGPEHYQEAERLAGIASNYDGLPNNHHIQAGQLGQLHATLALAAATALMRSFAGKSPIAEYGGWVEVAAEPPATEAGEDET